MTFEPAAAERGLPLVLEKRELLMFLGRSFRHAGLESSEGGRGGQRIK
jgi:hypothetical protein